MIPVFSPTPQHQHAEPEVTLAIQQVLTSGQFILGSQVTAFEQEVATYLGVEHAIGLASGTDALHLALLGAGIGPGDEVITSPFTFIATVEAIYYCGAKPVFADIDPVSLNIDPERVAKAVTKRTKAILPVHLFGLAADMEPLLELARAHQLKVIEDCAQAFGARYRNQLAGSFGDAGCFSFFPTKNLAGYGDGGMLTTNDKELAENVLALRNHGSKHRYHHDKLGFNSRLDEIQAAALRIKLQYIDTFNQSRRDIADAYNKAFESLPIQRPQAPEHCHHVYGQYTIQTDNRDQLKSALQHEDIGSAVYYPIPLHQQPVCKPDSAGAVFNTSEQAAARCLSLPVFPGMTEQQVEKVTDVVGDFYRTKSCLT
ncbi:erythromycin biosynthesis sensory transduction protein eryC1 [Aliidiomarina minuta]|uniref:Erythromycin biosynthesis sensory transduction protein eryC1 n=1 Tax=Aliidiomarina minuta TaxID=880057 RepID=A0A432W784_9GAMM|nr:DegT/DnrJ/EryC1/StrS family aminotransferase [Aliidiomarina minuta]RUO25938.1 erythromycin biosynthesis sensory transduction protein eryC1 [Aliidiomarina minuta]